VTRPPALDAERRKRATLGRPYRGGGVLRIPLGQLWAEKTLCGGRLSDIMRKTQNGKGSCQSNAPAPWEPGHWTLSKNRVIANQPEGWCGDLTVFAGNPGFLTKKCCSFMGDCHATAPAGAYRAQPPKAALGA